MGRLRRGGGDQGQVDPVRTLPISSTAEGRVLHATIATIAKHLTGLTIPSGVGGWDGGWVGLYDGW
eukprot:5652743-Prorocentrum_lima.AAC.1